MSTENSQERLPVTNAEIAAANEKRNEEKEPVVLNETERLLASLLQERANNFMLKKQLLVARSQELQKENASLDDSLRKVQQEISDFKSTLTCKYQVDFSKEQIDPETGRINPVSQVPPS